MKGDEIQIKQEQDLLFCKKTVEWLVSNTTVDTFNPTTFSGYQRRVHPAHCQRIANSIIKGGFYLPTAIICSHRNDGLYYVVDGQHRIEAFRLLKSENLDIFQQIKECETPVVILEKPELSVEIDTFVTINKTAKKVDTSLALVLKNYLNLIKKGIDTRTSRAEYLSVELAKRVSVDSEKNDIWYKKISFEGPVEHNEQTISLRAFVRSLRSVATALSKRGLINLDWKNDEELELSLTRFEESFMFFWVNVKEHWPSLFVGNLENLKIIQGPIGFGAFCIIASRCLNKQSGYFVGDLNLSISTLIRKMQPDSNAWIPGGYYSKFSSEYGYNFVAEELVKSDFS